MGIKNIAFIGLGVMGYPMSGHVAEAGYNVTVHNRTYGKAEAWQREYRGELANSPAAAAIDAQVVCICVADDNDLREVIFAEDGLLAVMKPGSIIVDHTTASTSITYEISETARLQGVGFLDAPISGGETGARSGTLSIMVGGSQGDYNTVLPVIQCYGKTINLMGSVGSGQLTKMVNQICIAATLQGVAEAIRFGLSAGLDMEKAISIIAGGAAQSWQLENRGPWMLDQRYNNGGFTVDLIRKDLALCVEEAKRTSTHIPVTQLIGSLFETLHDQGKGNWDFSSLFELTSGHD